MHTPVPINPTSVEFKELQSTMKLIVAIMERYKESNIIESGELRDVHTLNQATLYRQVVARQEKVKESLFEMLAHLRQQLRAYDRQLQHYSADLVV